MGRRQNEVNLEQRDRNSYTSTWQPPLAGIVILVSTNLAPYPSSASNPLDLSVSSHALLEWL